MKYPKIEEFRRAAYTAEQVDMYNEMQSRGLFNPVIPDTTVEKPVTKDYYMRSGDGYAEDAEILKYTDIKPIRGRIVSAKDIENRPVVAEIIAKNAENIPEEEPKEDIIPAVEEQPVEESFAPVIEGSTPVSDKDEEDDLFSYFVDTNAARTSQIMHRIDTTHYDTDKIEVSTVYGIVGSSDAPIEKEEESLSETYIDHQFDNIVVQTNNYDNYDDDDEYKRRNHNHRNKKKNNKWRDKNKGFNDPNSGMSNF